MYRRIRYDKSMAEVRHIEADKSQFYQVASDTTRAWRKSGRTGSGIGSQVEVHHIEAFVSQNVSEIAELHQGRIAADLRRLLEKYNERIGAVEPDQSLQIEIPQNLR